MQKKKQNDFAPQIDFKEQTPEMQLKEVKPDPLYEKEFLSREDSRKGVEPISLTEANSRIFLRAFSYKAIALSRKIANKSIENLLSVRCKQFTDINQ